MKPPKKTEPTALDRLFNITVNDRDFWKMLVAQAEKLAPECYDQDLCVQAARKTICERLTSWVYVSGFSGRQTKKMVEKATKRVLKGYHKNMRTYYLKRASELDEEAKTAKEWYQRYEAQEEAERLRKLLAENRIGKQRYQRWPTR
jgi:hypothetical protein